jgi:hypothetical protein
MVHQGQGARCGKQCKIGGKDTFPLGSVRPDEVIGILTVAEKKIRNIGNLSGALLIACLLVAFFFSFALVIPSVHSFYNSGLSGQSFVNVIYTLVVVGGTFWVFGYFLRQHATNQTIETGGVDCYSFKMNF